MIVLPEKYVVLDVETNGLSSLKDDLLSITIYQPDTEKIYNRFLPLELNRDVFTTHINGITKKDLKKATALTQKEVDDLIEAFDLINRTILTYGNIDEKFIKNYFKRKKLKGYNKLTFFNFKRNIISSSFSGGNITKDNLCMLYKIENVSEIHSGINDCKLEWKLFEKMNGNKLLITDDKVFEFNDDYIVPVSYLDRFPNFKYHTKQLPKIICTSQIVERFDISSDKIKKFPTNFNGLVIENLINTMLNVEKINSFEFLANNKRKLKQIGKLPSLHEDIYMRFNDDGTVSAVAQKDKKLSEELNQFILLLKEEITPVVRYIKEYIFKNEKIFSQELVVHKDKKVLALCDLSSQSAVLELKTYDVDLEKVANQLFYESNGRKCYIIKTIWSTNKKRISFIILEVTFKIDNSPTKNSLEKRINDFRNKISNKEVEVIEYIDSHSQIILKCVVCGNMFSKSYDALLKHSECPYCNPIKKSTNKRRSLTQEEKAEKRYKKYQDKLNDYSDRKITALSYYGAKENLIAKCNNCGNEWTVRADHLLSKPYCRLCKKTSK